MALHLWLLSSFLVVLAWILAGCLSPGPERPPRVNYDGTVHYSHDNLHVPSTKMEIIDLVKSAVANDRKIRVLSSGHSWSEIAVSDDISVSLHNFTGLVSVDRSTKQVTVRAGTTFKSLNDILEEHGLALPVLGSISEQTAAGAIATGTHGTGLGFKNLANLVTKLEIITGTGEVLTVSHDHNSDLMKAAQVSIGMLGIVIEVTFQCVDSFNLEETCMPTTVDYCLDNMMSIAKSAEHVKMWMETSSGVCALFMVNRTDEQPRDNPFHFITSLKNRFFEAVMLVGSWFPKIARPGTKFIFTVVNVFQPHNRVDVSYRVFNIPHYIPVHHETELILGVDDCADGVRALKWVVDEFDIPLNFVTEVRFVQADDIWLSPDYGKDTCHITVTLYNAAKETRLLYFNEVYKATKQYHARLHWGKYFELTPSDVREGYPMVGEFGKVRSRLDPKGVFMNQQLLKTFGF